MSKNAIPCSGRRMWRWVYAAIAFSGLTALGAEVVWTRLLSLLLGATVYTFSIILAVFLAGLWVGSGAGSFLARRVRDPGLALAGCQILLAAAIAWTAFTLAHVLPWWPVDPWLATNPWFNFDLDLTRCLRAIFPATLLWGASFPLALAAAAANREDPGRLTGEVYSANTAGSIVGALAFSLLLIPAVGTQSSQQVLIWLAAAAAVVAVAPVVSEDARLRPSRIAGRWLAWRGSAGVGLVGNRRRCSLAGDRLWPPCGAYTAGPESRHRWANQPGVRGRGNQLLGGDRTTRRSEIFLCQR